MELFGLIFAPLLIWIGWRLYMLPWYIARGKRENNKLLFLVNLFGGATGGVWLFCLIWAASVRKEVRQ